MSLGEAISEKKKKGTGEKSPPKIESVQMEASLRSKMTLRPKSMPAEKRAQ